MEIKLYNNEGLRIAATRSNYCEDFNFLDINHVANEKLNTATAYWFNNGEE